MSVSHLAIGLVGIAVLATAQVEERYASSCGLGAVWEVRESGWSGTWVRRGSSNTFDATWRKGSARGTSTLTMTLRGNRVTIQRQDAADFIGGARYVYEGAIEPDGSFSGMNNGTYPIEGKVRCGQTAATGGGGGGARPAAPPQVSSGSTPDSWSCGLGAVWEVRESGWSSTWVRRGSSNTFDATWRKGSMQGTSTLTMTLNGNRVTIQRQDAANFIGGGRYTYEGTIGPDGSFSGINNGTYPIEGKVSCGGGATTGSGGGNSRPAATQQPNLGNTLVVVYPGPCTAIWTRTQPGEYDALTICQGPKNASFRETLRVESFDGRNAVIARPNYGRYRGSLSGDGKTLRGTCDWQGCGANQRWIAYVDLNWNDAPPLPQ